MSTADPQPLLALSSTASTSRSLLAAVVGLLLGFGTLMVYSASVTSWPTEVASANLARHLVFLCAGVSAGLIAACVPPTLWFRCAAPLWWGTLLLLGLTLVPGLGVSVNGAQRWLALGPVRVQPSELAKVTLPLYTARILVRTRAAGRLDRLLLGGVPLLLPTLLICGLVFLEPDLGTAVFLFGSTLLVLWLGGWPLKFFILGGLACGPVAALGLSMKPYQQARIEGFLRGLADWREAPYQLKQSLISFGAGGVSGAGIGRGWQKLSFLPEAHTDFVFAVVGEELGLVGTLGVVCAWACILVFGLRQLRRVPHTSYRWLVAAVLLTQTVVQAAINMAVATAVVPPKGISHPLLSAGGSNLIATLIALGIVFGMTRGKPIDTR